MTRIPPLQLLCLFLCLLLSGCGTLPDGQVALVQQALDAALPASFKGDLHIDHTNPYIKGSIDAGALRRGPTGWEFDWLVYKRNGWGSNGSIRLGKVPAQFQ
jgi:hypothetical protein